MVTINNLFCHNFFAWMTINIDLSMFYLEAARKGKGMKVHLWAKWRLAIDVGHEISDG